MTSGKEAILGRIREALLRTAPPPGHHDAGCDEHDHGHDHGAPAVPEGSHRPESFKAWLPAVGESYEARVELFAKNSAELKTTFIRCATKADALKALKEVAQLEAWAQIAYHRAPLAAELSEGLGLPGMTTDAGYDPFALEKCDVGISVCDALIAQTGSVLLSTVSAGGRALTVLTPHHVVIATREQMFPDLAAGYEYLGRMYGSKWPSFSTVITGPSRTGDIERILVLGAHGPKKLTILLIEG